MNESVQTLTYFWIKSQISSFIRFNYTSSGIFKSSNKSIKIRFQIRFGQRVSARSSDIPNILSLIILITREENLWLIRQSGCKKREEKATKRCEFKRTHWKMRDQMRERPGDRDHDEATEGFHVYKRRSESKSIFTSKFVFYSSNKIFLKLNSIMNSIINVIKHIIIQLGINEFRVRLKTLFQLLGTFN